MGDGRFMGFFIKILCKRSWWTVKVWVMTASIVLGSCFQVPVVRVLLPSFFSPLCSFFLILVSLFTRTFVPWILSGDVY